MRIQYLANARLPTEKAHGLQIVENCEALAAAGAEVTLVVPRRINTQQFAGADIWTHYGVRRSFAVRRIPCLDLMPFAGRLEPVAAVIEMASFAMAAAFTRGRPADVYYSRDALPLVVLGLFRPSRVLAYEAHQLARGRVGSWLQRWCLGRARAVFAVTDRLAADLRARGARRVIVLRDGFRADRFASLPDRADARRQLHLPLDAFVVGYVGRLETMGMSKGLDVLVRALSRIASPDLHLCLVGGPLDHASALGRLWVQSGLPAGACHVVDDVPPAQIPLFLAAFDVCAMPLPSTPHFDHHASPLKLFEYMAAGRAIVASALPSVAEVVRHGESALLVPPGDADELAGAIARLREDDALRTRLGDSARREATGYAWNVRAARILEELSTSRGQ